MRVKSAALLGVIGFAAAQGPCDIYEAVGHPCVAAHSTTRALYDNYTGPLYLVNRTENEAQIITARHGFADSATQDTFCAASTCIITRIFDQSPQGNHLDTAPGGPWYAPFKDKGVNASRARLTVGGRLVYAAVFEGGMVTLIPHNRLQFLFFFAFAYSRSTYD